MEKKKKKRSTNPVNNKSKINLKDLPPIDPSKIMSARQVKQEKPSVISGRPESEEAMKLAKSDDSSRKIDLVDRTQKLELNGSNADAGVANKGLAKAKLHEVCTAYKWKSPVFECYKEEGPSHNRLFMIKVSLKIESSNTMLECFGAPQSSKKLAAEHAAEGALWFLKYRGYFPIQKRKTK